MPEILEISLRFFITTPSSLHITDCLIESELHVCQCECWTHTAQSVQQGDYTCHWRRNVKRERRQAAQPRLIHASSGLLCAHMCMTQQNLWQSRSGSTSTCHVELNSLIQQTRRRHAGVQSRGLASVCATVSAGLGQMCGLDEGKEKRRRDLSRDGGETKGCQMKNITLEDV